MGNVREQAKWVNEMSRPAWLNQDEQKPMTEDEWLDLENEIATAIDDSMDIDWTADVGARAIVDMLKAFGYQINLPLAPDQ